MSWSQAKTRKWHRENPGKSRMAQVLRRVIRRRRGDIARNLTIHNSLLTHLRGRE